MSSIKELKAKLIIPLGRKPAPAKTSESSDGSEAKLLDVSAAKSRPKRRKSSGTMRASRSASDIREKEGNNVKKSPSSDNLTSYTGGGKTTVEELAESAQRREEEQDALRATSTSPEPATSPGTISIGELRSLALSAKSMEEASGKASDGPTSPVIESNLTVGEARSLALSPRKRNVENDEDEPEEIGGGDKRSVRPSSPRKKSVRRKKKERGKLPADVASPPAKIPNGKMVGSDMDEEEEDSSEVATSNANAAQAALETPSRGGAVEPPVLLSPEESPPRSSSPAPSSPTRKKKGMRKSKKKAASSPSLSALQSKLDEANARAEDEKKLRLATDSMISKLLARQSDEALVAAVQKWQDAEQELRELKVELAALKRKGRKKAGTPAKEEL